MNSKGGTLLRHAVVLLSKSVKDGRITAVNRTVWKKGNKILPTPAPSLSRKIPV